MLRLVHSAGACLLLAIACSVDVESSSMSHTFAPGILLLDANTAVGEESFISGYPAQGEDGAITVVVVMPAGTLEQWKISQPTEFMKREFNKGRPGQIRYLVSPGNCGIIPRTLMEPDQIGGDGDPLDVLVLGPPLLRGSVITARPVAVLRLFDDDRRDDKIIAVADDRVFGHIEDLHELEAEFPGVAAIINTWFCNYKRGGNIRTIGFGDSEEARKMIRRASNAFRKVSTTFLSRNDRLPFSIRETPRHPSGATREEPCNSFRGLCRPWWPGAKGFPC